MPTKLSVEFPPGSGQRVSGLDMEFEPVKEPWTEYKLENGGKLRLRVILGKAIVTEKKTDSGEPLVVVNANVMVSYKGPETDEAAVTKLDA